MAESHSNKLPDDRVNNNSLCEAVIVSEIPEDDCAELLSMLYEIIKAEKAKGDSRLKP